MLVALSTATRNGQCKGKLTHHQQEREAGSASRRCYSTLPASDVSRDHVASGQTYEVHAGWHGFGRGGPRRPARNELASRTGPASSRRTSRPENVMHSQHDRPGAHELVADCRRSSKRIRRGERSTILIIGPLPSATPTGSGIFWTTIGFLEAAPSIQKRPAISSIR